MCFMCSQCYRLIYCCMHMCTRLCSLGIFMLENIIHTGLMTCYSIIAALLQICSIMPSICMFLITSKLSWIMCSSGGNCQKYPICGCYFLIFVIIIILYFLKLLDPVVKLFGYVRKSKKKLRMHTQVPESSPSLDDMDLKEALQMLDFNFNETMAMASAEKTQDVSGMKLANATIANATIAKVIKLLSGAMSSDMNLMNATIASGVKLLNETIAKDLDVNDSELPPLDLNMIFDPENIEVDV